MNFAGVAVTKYQRLGGLNKRDVLIQNETAAGFGHSKGHEKESLAFSSLA